MSGKVQLTWSGRGELPGLKPLKPAWRETRIFGGTGKASGGKGLLIQGDNLTALRMLLPELQGRVQLVYLDPPYATGNEFFTGRKKRGTLKETSPAYSDSWTDGLGGYLSMLYPRLVLVHRLLAKTGAVFVHLDFRTAHLVRLLLDEIFGGENFINEIIWYYKTGGMPEKLGFGRKHDTILFYARDRKHTKWRPQKERSPVKHRYGFANIRLLEDDQGLYTLVGMRDVWDIPALRGNQPERVNYPTQKPLALLERIVKAVTDPGDLVLDPFCGSGTTLLAAENLGRNWVGVDSAPAAVWKTAERFLVNGAEVSFRIRKPAVPGADVSPGGNSRNPLTAWEKCLGGRMETRGTVLTIGDSALVWGPGIASGGLADLVAGLAERGIDVVKVLFPEGADDGEAAEEEVKSSRVVLVRYRVPPTLPRRCAPRRLERLLVEIPGLEYRLETGKRGGLQLELTGLVYRRPGFYQERLLRENADPRETLALWGVDRFTRGGWKNVWWRRPKGPGAWKTPTLRLGKAPGRLLLWVTDELGNHFSREIALPRRIFLPE